MMVIDGIMYETFKELQLELQTCNGDYYARMIAFDPAADKAGLKIGIWTDTKELPRDLTDKLFNVIKEIASYVEDEEE